MHNLRNIKKENESVDKGENQDETNKVKEVKKEVPAEELIQLQETTMRSILIQKLNDDDPDSLYQYHAFLSEQYGTPLGVFDDPLFEEKIKRKLSKIDNAWITNIDKILEDLRGDGTGNL